MGSAWVEGEGQETEPASLILPVAGELGGGRGGEGREGGLALVLDAACLHLVLHYASLFHISILLWGLLLYKNACGKPYKLCIDILGLLSPNNNLNLC